MIRATANIALFALALLLPAIFLRKPVPEYFAGLYDLFRHADPDVELILTGSSLIRQVDNATFMLELERAGSPAVTLNLGVHGMMLPEVEVFLRYLLENEAPRLRWVLIELHPWRLRNVRPRSDVEAIARNPQLEAGMMDHMDMTERSVWWHTPRNTLRMLRLGWRGGDTLRAQAHEALQGLRHLSPVGYALHRWNWLTGSTSGSPPGMGGEEIVLPPAFQFTPAQYQRCLDALTAEDPAWERDLTAAYVSDLSRRLRQRGLVPIFVIPPAALPANLTNARELKSLLPSETVWDFSDPARWPELFAFHHRLENVHLNPEGNRIFARELARLFARFRLGEGSAAAPEAAARSAP